MRLHYEGQPDHGYDPNQLLLEGQPDRRPVDQHWNGARHRVYSSGVAGRVSHVAPTMNVAAGGWPTGYGRVLVCRRPFRPTFGSHGGDF